MQFLGEKVHRLRNGILWRRQLLGKNNVAKWNSRRKNTTVVMSSRRHEIALEARMSISSDPNTRNIGSRTLVPMFSSRRSTRTRKGLLTDLEPRGSLVLRRTGEVLAQTRSAPSENPDTTRVVFCILPGRSADERAATTRLGR